MATLPVDPRILEETFRVYVSTGKSIRKTAQILNLARSTLRNRLQNYAKATGIKWDQPVAAGDVHGFETVTYKLPKKNNIKRYIISSAQSNTYVHEPFLENLKTYADFCFAEIMVAQFSYNKSAYGKKSIKPGSEPTEEDKDDIWFDPLLDPYVCNNRIQLAPTLAFCGEMNILPTAVAPLTGFEVYPGNHVSAIFPHSTIALESIAGMKGQNVKFNYTTGAVTLRNYIQKRAGLRAEFSHSYAALIVEINSDGDWWVRQLNAKDDGSFYDLDVLVSEGEVTQGHAVEAIVWGDIHYDVIDPVVEEMNWGEGGLMDTLKPKYQFLHDLVDFHARNHHNVKNPHARFERFIENRSNVKKEMLRVRDFLNSVSYREGCQTVVVDSNHDRAFERWLRESDYRYDEENAVFFLECQLKKYSALEVGDENFHMVESVLKDLEVRPTIKFLRQDESFKLGGEDGIELGMHGHLGANGAKGDPRGLAKVGNRAITGHTHTARILGGLYVVGTCSKLSLDYNHGSSSWSWSQCLIYPNGKRALLTYRNKHWRA